MSRRVEVVEGVVVCWSNRLGRRGPERLDESFGFDRGIGQGRPWIDRSLGVKPRPWWP